MQKRLLTSVLMVILLLLVIVPTALAVPLLYRTVNNSGEVDTQRPNVQTGEEEKPKLATASVVAQLSSQPGRALVTARANHLIVDSPPLLGGPNEALNPVDLLLAALASCSTFVYETAAQEMDVPLEQVVATVEADFDPRGVKGEPVDPRIQAFRVHLAVTGATQEQAEALADQWRQRCPIYTTLIRSAPIEIEITINEAMAEAAEAIESPAAAMAEPVEAGAKVSGDSTMEPLAVGDPKRGREIFETGGGVISGGMRCAYCHSLDGTVNTGPSLQGIAAQSGSRVPELAAVEYLRQSIVDPSTYIVAGFDDNRMSKAYKFFLSDEEINDLVAFLLTQ